MSDVIRLELTGKQAEAWNRVFDTLAGVVVRAVEHLIPDDGAEKKEQARQMTEDLAEITKGWAKAKIERPTLENEKIIADITAKFEEAKLTRAKREQVEVETQKKRLELWEQRVAMALRWLGFLGHHIIRGEDGSVTVVLTNRALALLHADVKALPGG